MEFLLDFLFFGILGIYLFRTVMRWLLPFLFQKVVNKAQQGQQQQQYRNQEPTGRIKVDYIPEQTKKSHIPDSEGEFVKYEEIK